MVTCDSKLSPLEGTLIRFSCRTETVKLAEGAADGTLTLKYPTFWYLQGFYVIMDRHDYGSG